MSNENETGTETLDSSSNTIDLRLRQESKIDHQGIDTSTNELTLRSVNERSKQATGRILRRVEEICALLAGQWSVRFETLQCVH